MLLNDPAIVDEEKLAAEIEHEGRVPAFNFQRPRPAMLDILARVNALCRKFGAKICARFCGHYKARFDFATLQKIPDVPALIVDLRARKTCSAGDHWRAGDRRF
jgi:hypothetical protein